MDIIDTIIEMLARPVKIREVSIYNFTSLDELISIEISVEIDKDEVRNLNIDSGYYGCSEKSQIIIEDISEAQKEDVFYNISI